MSLLERVGLEVSAAVQRDLARNHGMQDDEIMAAGMKRIPLTVVLGCWVAACGLGQGSTSQPVVAPTSPGDPRPVSSAVEPRREEPVPQVRGDECNANSDCFIITCSATTIST
jgi:hypothetical protein